MIIALRFLNVEKVIDKEQAEIKVRRENAEQYALKQVTSVENSHLTESISYFLVHPSLTERLLKEFLLLIILVYEITVKS